MGIVIRRKKDRRVPYLNGIEEIVDVVRMSRGYKLKLKNGKEIATDNTKLVEVIERCLKSKSELFR